MTERVRDGREMVRQMLPRLLPGRYVFRTVAREDAGAAQICNARGMFVEDEGLSLILEAGSSATDAFRQITLDVHSALDGIGLTAAVSARLAAQGIPSNIVAANHHDHIFVPEAQAEAALDALLSLSRDAELEGQEE